MEKLVVVIEDNENNMELFKDLLQTISDIKVLTDYRGDSGLELIKKNNPDLIILDIALPGKTGFEICRELRELDRFKNIPILAVTAFAMKGDKKNILESGFTNYISKPLKVVEFRNIVMEYLS